MSIPRVHIRIFSFPMIAATYIDLSEGRVRQGVLAVVVGDGDGDSPVTHPGGELRSGAGIFLRRGDKQIIQQTEIV